MDCRLIAGRGTLKKPPRQANPEWGGTKGRAGSKVRHTWQRRGGKGGAELFFGKTRFGRKTGEFFEPDLVKIHAAKNRRPQEVENPGKRGNT